MLPNTMLNKQKIDQFWQARTKIADPRVATSLRRDGRLELDTELVKRLLPAQARILDLGAGTCTLASELLDSAAEIVAVDKFPGFLEAAPKDPRLKTVCSDVVSFQSNDQFDAILLFGVSNYLTAEEEERLYERCRGMLTAPGVFIVKNQCGVDEEVIVDRYSEELGCHYHARYPVVNEQCDRLASYFTVTVVDIYPPELNRWPDTHFYAFVCRPRSS